MLSDDLRAPAQDTAHVRLLSASATAASVTVTAPDGAVVASGAQFAVPTGYDEVRPGRVALTVRQDGVSDEAGDSTEVNFASGSTYTVLVLDRTGGGLELRALVDAAGMDSLPTGWRPDRRRRHRALARHPRTPGRRRAARSASPVPRSSSGPLPPSAGGRDR